MSMVFLDFLLIRPLPGRRRPPRLCLYACITQLFLCNVLQGLWFLSADLFDLTSRYGVTKTIGSPSRPA
jgi:hypothetical protein